MFFDRLTELINFYFIVYSLGAICVVYVLILAIRSKKVSLKEEQAYDLAIVTIIGVLIGARIFNWLFWDYEYYLHSPIELFIFSRNGFSFHGGVIGGLVASFIYTKIKKIKLFPILDVIVIPTTLVIAFGRIANFLNGEIVGKISSSQICIFMKDLSGCRYPVTLYSAAAQVVLFFILVSMSSNSSRKMKPGRIFLAFLFFSGIFRFFLDFLVEDKTYFFLTNGQWLSLITIFFSLVLFMFEKRRGCLFKKPNTHKLDN